MATIGGRMMIDARGTYGGAGQHPASTEDRRKQKTLAVALLTVLAIPSSGCSTVYLHSASEQKAADDVKSGLDTAHTAHLAAIDTHRTYLQAAIANERTLVVKREIALRDQTVSAILTAGQRHTDSPEALLARAVGDRLTKLTGVSADPTTGAFDALGQIDLRSAKADADRSAANLASARARRDIYIAQFEDAKGKGQYCDDQGQNGGTTPTVPGTRPYIFAAIRSVCDEISGDEADLKSTDATLNNPIAVSMVDPEADVSKIPPGSALALAISTAQSLRVAIGVQSALARGASSHLADLQHYYDCQTQLAGAKDATGKLADTAKQVQDFINWVDTASKTEVATDVQARPAAAAAPAAPAAPGAPAGATCSAGGATISAPPAVTSAADLIGHTTASNLADVKKAVATLASVDVASSLLGSIQQAVQDYRASTLSDVVAALADPTPGKQSSKEAIIAASFARLLGHAEKLDQVLSGRLPDTSGVLVQLAEARMLSASAQAEADRLKSLKTLADLRVKASQQEGVDLQDANLVLVQNGVHAFDRALMRYASSWSEGSIPAAAVDSDARGNAYLAWIDRERIVVDTSYAVLSPGAAEMQAHGAGGFTPTDIANYLQAIGLGAIAIH